MVFQGLFNDIQDQHFDHQFLYTVVTNFNTIKRCLPKQASIYTDELHVIQLALDVIHDSNKNKYILYTDSLSCLQTFEHKHIHDPLVLDALLKYSALINKTNICWVPNHFGIRGNDLADETANAALNQRHYHTLILSLWCRDSSDENGLISGLLRLITNVIQCSARWDVDTVNWRTLQRTTIGSHLCNSGFYLLCSFI